LIDVASFMADRVGNALCFQAKFSIVTTNETLDRVEGILRVEDDCRRAICPRALLFAEEPTEGLSHSFCIGNHHRLATLHDGDY